jgi:hypothetical protein
MTKLWTGHEKAGDKKATTKFFTRYLAENCHGFLVLMRKPLIIQQED